MFDISLKILRRLEEEGEMKISDISLLLPKKYNDHRDFYSLASLIVQGFVEDSMLKKNTMNENPEYRAMKIQKLTWKLFAISNADNKAQYNGQSWLMSGSDKKFRDELYSLTGLGYLYLDEIRNKNRDRLFTLLIAIFSAVFASTLTFYLGRLI